MLRGTFQRTIAQWRRLGSLRFLQLAFYRLLRIYPITDWLWDRRLGIHTRAHLNPRNYGIKDASTHSYTPTCYLEVKEALRHVRFVPGKDSFLDYGSGMGRVVILAATYPFRRSIGVEFCAEFNEVARRNAERAKPRLACQNVELITADARDYAVPSDVTVIFLYSPFEADVLEKVLRNIRRSLEEAPRPMSVIYVVPTVLESQVGRPDWLVKREDFVPLYRPGAIYDARLPGR
jgi:SAM-dependent methyltransferase